MKITNFERLTEKEKKSKKKKKKINRKREKKDFIICVKINSDINYKRFS